MNNPSTEQQCVDAALDLVLRASGSALRHYSMPGTLSAMRDAMRGIISAAYTAGLNDRRDQQGDVS